MAVRYLICSSLIFVLSCSCFATGGYFDAGPVGLWNLNDDAADTDVADSSGSGYTGTAAQNTEDINLAGKLSGALSFNGAADCIEINAVLADTAGTYKGLWSAWVYHEVADQDGMIITAGDASAARRIRFCLDAGQLLAQVYATGDKWKVATDADLATAEWVHVGLRQDGTEPVLYVNGAVLAQTFSTTTLKAAWFYVSGGFDTMRIGDDNYNNGGEANFFNGNMDNIVIFNIDVCCIKRIYNGGTGTETINSTTVRGNGDPMM